MRKILLVALIATIVSGEVNTNPSKTVSACIINANERYINACINGVRYALEAELDDTIYNEYSLKPIFVGTTYSKCTCSIERVRRRVTVKTTYDYDPTAWKIQLKGNYTPTKEALKGLKKLEPKKPKLKTSIVCVKC